MRMEMTYGNWARKNCKWFMGMGDDHHHRSNVGWDLEIWISGLLQEVGSNMNMVTNHGNLGQRSSLNGLWGVR